MKTPLIYGAVNALIGALITYAFFFAGFHDTPDKMKQVQTFSTVIIVVVSVVCLALAMRERRAEFPADRNWGYGTAFGAGAMTAVWATVFGTVSAYIYFGIVNPQFSETVYQMQVQALEAKGLSASQIESASGMMRTFTGPIAMCVSQAIMGFLGGVILSLIVAIFFRNRPQVVEADATLSPPPLA